VSEVSVSVESATNIIPPSQAIDLDKSGFDAFKQEYGQLSELARTHEAYFLHGMWVKMGRGLNNSLIRQNTSLADRLSIVCDQKPTISISSVKESEQDTHTFRPIGVLLSGGLVESAGMFDSFSQPHSTHERAPVGGRLPDKKSRYKEEIDMAIDEQGKKDYNELIVSNPEPAGFFINLDQIAKLQKGSDGLPTSPSDSALRIGFAVEGEQCYFQDLNTLVNEFGMGIFVFVKGVLHRAGYNNATGGLLIGEIIHSDEVPAIKPVQTPQQKMEIHERALSALNNSRELPVVD